MSILFKELINQRLRKITVTELLDYSNQYGFSLDRSQAKDIVSYLKTNNINPFTKKERQKMLRQLAEITDGETAEKANQLFIQLVESYGLSNLFES
ncbi:DUF2624 domain-containing protein [Virgibacillus halophilus]|uniref:DUF2624 domain-containing protein n=1 Tax=Tigheibacillus halophilus TaxID=361280 RepID=UPI00363736C7